MWGHMNTLTLSNSGTTDPKFYALLYNGLPVFAYIYIGMWMPVAPFTNMV